MPSIPARTNKSLRERLNIRYCMVPLIFLAIAAARLTYVALYASSLPFWDQWDELNQLFRPWHNGSWHWTQLFSAHNEHRIALTRILGLALFVLNGHMFDNLVESNFNTFLYAGMWTLAYTLMIRGEVGRARCMLLAVAVAVLGVLPFDWENTLVGFQSQFYLMEITAIVLLGVASFRAPSGATLLTLLSIGTIGLFTMAAGVLAIPAACMVMVLLAWRNRSHAAHALLTCLLLACLTAIGLAIIPHVAGDDAFKSKGITEHVHALLVALIWPMQGLSLRTIAFAALVWMPTMVWTWRYVRRRQATKREIFSIGLCVWVFLQFLAIAHARGHDMNSLPSRYTEIPALGIAANLWLALQLMPSSGKWRIGAACAALVGIFLTAYAFRLRTPDDHVAMVQRHEFTSIETLNVHNYVQGEAFPPAQEGSLTLPYPHLSRLQNFLNMPAMLSILPVAAHPPLPVLSHDTQRFQEIVRGWFTEHVNGTDSPQFLPSGAKLPANAPTAFCSLDQIIVNGIVATDHEVSVHDGSMLHFAGWITDNARKVSNRFTIRLTSSDPNSYTLSARAGLSRPDVARALQSKSARHAGYSVMAPMTDIPQGDYRIILTTHTSGQVNACDTKWTLKVSAPVNTL